jgi:chromosome segregation ATPase
MDEDFDGEIEGRASPTCCFEPLSQDLQIRLKRAHHECERLKEELMEKNRTIDQLRCEFGQLTSQKRNADDQATILATKGRLLKAELKRQTEANADLRSEIETLRSDNDQLQASLAQARAKGKKLKTAMVSSHFVESRAANMESQNQKQQVRIQQLEMEREECSRHREILERKIHRLNERIRAAVDSEKPIQLLNDQIQQLKGELKIQSDNNANLNLLKEEIEMKLKQAELALSAQPELKRRANDSARLEMQIQSLRKENENLLCELTEVRSVAKSFRQTQADLDQSVSENRILRGQIQEMKALVEKVEQLENENNSLSEKLANLMDQNAKREESVWIASESALRISDLEKENTTMRQSTMEMSAEISSLKKHYEEVSHQVLQLTHEIRERERREQHLAARYRFYKAKSEEQQTNLKVCNGTIDDLGRELSRMKERESHKEAALRRKRRCETQYDLQRSNLLRQLDSQRDKVVELETALRTVRGSGNF